MYANFGDTPSRTSLNASGSRHSATSLANVVGEDVQTVLVTTWTDPARDVLVLGAGFSRAVSGRMPLTDELGNLCLEVGELRADPRVPSGGFSGGEFEQWLSTFAEPQPFLSEHENLENQALFLRFARAIDAVLGSWTDEVLANAAPAWLLGLVTAAHCRRSTLMSFNYDVLVECAIKTRHLFLPASREPVYWAEVIGDVPSWPPGSARLGAEQVDTLRLLKLHGSLNWYWTPGDASGVSLARRDLPGAFHAPEPYSEEDRRRELPGRESFLVPPSATKSSYYRNPVVRELWTQAADALRCATTVSFLGYSLPIADGTVSAMFRKSMVGSSAPVRIADLSPAPVAERVTALGVASQRVSIEETSLNPIVDFALRFCRETSALVLEAVALAGDELRGAPLAVYWSPEKYSAAVEVRCVGGDVVLVLEAPTYQGAAIRPRPEQSLPTLGDVLRHVRDRSAWLACDHTGATHQIVDAAGERWNNGYGDGHWNLLTASGAAPATV